MIVKTTLCDVWLFSWIDPIMGYSRFYCGYKVRVGMDWKKETTSFFQSNFISFPLNYSILTFQVREEKRPSSPFHTSIYFSQQSNREIGKFSSAFMFDSSPLDPLLPICFLIFLVFPQFRTSSSWILPQSQFSSFGLFPWSEGPRIVKSVLLSSIESPNYWACMVVPSSKSKTPNI